MKNACFIALVFLASASGLTAQNWQWSRGAAGICAATVVCTDPAGNVCVAGYLNGQVVMGQDTLTSTSGPYQSVFIARYDAAGNMLWARDANGYADADGICTDTGGNVYLIGNFYGDSVSFGSYVLTDTAAGNSHIYLAKYSPAGSLLWVKNIGGGANDLAASVSTDAAGYVYITGNFSADSLPIGHITLQHIGSSDGFVAKLDGNGDALWAHNVGGPNSAGASYACADAYGNVYLTGYFSYNYLYVGSLSRLIASPYTNDLFITKYDSAGINLWTQYAGGNDYSNPTPVTITCDSSGNATLTGYFNGAVIFGADTLLGDYVNIFSAQYSSSGAMTALSNIRGTFDQISTLTTDGAGHIYVTGYFQGDSVPFGSTKLINTSGNEMTFAAAYDTSGQALWAIAAAGTSNNAGAAIACNNGSVYVAGSYEGANITFGSDTIPYDPLFPLQENFFLAKVDAANLTGITQANDPAYRIIVYPNPSTGRFYFSGVPDGYAIEVYDMMGQEITSPPALSPDETYGTVSKGEGANSRIVNLSGRSKGVYLYRISAQGGTVVEGKMVVE